MALTRFAPLVVLLLWAHTAGLHAAVPSDAERCTIGDKHASLKALCTSVSVPSDPDSANTEAIDLAVAVLPARGRHTVNDPLVFIAGGPGQSALSTFPAVARAFRHVNRRRDIILIDQRGTGDSGLLDCEQNVDAAATPDDIDALVEQARRDAKTCFESLQADARLYTTSIAVQDLDAVRQHLGVEQWTLYGVSYGTRVALHYARRYPQATRALVLDAVVPPGTPLGPDIAPLAQRALSLILERCAADTACNSAFPDINAKTRAFVAELAAAPITVSWEDIARGKRQTTEFTQADLATSLRLLSYSAHGAALLPSLLHDAIVERHLAPLARQAELQTRTLQDTLATGMHHAVVCTEDIPFMDLDAAETQARDTYLGDTALRVLAAACEAWPSGRIDADFHEPWELDAPTLLLSGEADPVTPPAYAERVLTMASSGHHIQNAGQGHMQMPLGCIPQIVADFVERLDPDDLPTECLERLQAPPFFVDANGPLP